MRRRYALQVWGRAKRGVPGGGLLPEAAGDGGRGGHLQRRAAPAPLPQEHDSHAGTLYWGP